MPDRVSYLKGTWKWEWDQLVFYLRFSMKISSFLIFNILGGGQEQCFYFCNCFLLTLGCCCQDLGRLESLSKAMRELESIWFIDQLKRWHLYQLDWSISVFSKFRAHIYLEQDVISNWCLDVCTSQLETCWDKYKLEIEVKIYELIWMP